MIELNNFEEWVLKKRSIWFHIIVGYFTAFIWTFIYFYCKFQKNKKIKQKEDLLKLEKQDIENRLNRTKTTLVFNKKLKVVETSHPKRQKALKDIKFIMEHDDTPEISVSIDKKALSLFYCDIDSNKEQPIGVVYEYISDIYNYYSNPDYKVITEYEIEKEEDIYNLYVKIKIYN